MEDSRPWLSPAQVVKPALPVFSCFAGGTKAHEELFQKVLPVAQAFQPVGTAWQTGTPALPDFSGFLDVPMVP
jgi:hypothetical protein